ncbi:MAG: acyl-CoA thioesterase domain-containing protein [Actinomycetota bacterium]
MFELSPHGVDVHVGTGPQYPWGGLYGGQIVAQALRAATLSADEGFEPHSIRAYFIRRGDASEPVRYEVDRIRNGRSFQTRRVVARQAIGAILNAEASFQRPEASEVIQTCVMPEVPAPDELELDSWSDAFERASVPPERVDGPGRDGAGRSVAWMRASESIGDRDDADSQLLHRCWLAYLSDDLPTDAVIRAHPLRDADDDVWFAASLDHTMWFHRPIAADAWHLHDVSCHHFVGGRGLAIGHVFEPDGTHVATISQEVLIRDRRTLESPSS